MLDGLYLLQLFSGGDKGHPRSGMADKIGGLVGGQRGVDGNVNDSAADAGEVGDHPFRAILAQDGNAVALLQAPLAKGPGQVGDIFVILA